jgi:hypothetical protein
MKRVPVLFVFVSLLSGYALKQTAAQTLTSSFKQPVFIYLFARVTDHVNIDLSEQRLRRALTEVDTYRKAHPEFSISATIFLSGSVSQALQERNAQTGIKDLVADYVRRGVIELGYDGADEPTYQTRPLANIPRDKTPEEHWALRQVAAEQTLTEGRDSLTGAPIPGTSGGLKKMQEVFGEAVCIAGIAPKMGEDVELVYQLSQYNKNAIMSGIPYANPAHIPGYRGSIAQFSRELSPISASSPEFFWQDDVLRVSETSDPAMQPVNGYDGVDGLQAVLNKIDRSKIRIVHAELASDKIYLKPTFVQSDSYPALKYAYEHPNAPQVPMQEYRTGTDIQNSYAKEEGLLKWLQSEYLPGNPKSRFISNAALKQMTPPSYGFSLPMDKIQAGMKELLRLWGQDTHLPFYAEIDGHYLSLANAFQISADALAQLSRSGKLPEGVQVVKVYGPISTPLDHGPNVGEVTVGEIAHAAVEISKQLHNSSWSPVPANAVPSWIRVGGTRVNSAQFLYLMAQAVVNPAPSAKLSVKMMQMFSVIIMTYPEERPREEIGNLWSVKPAPLQPDAVTKASQ